MTKEMLKYSNINIDTFNESVNIGTSSNLEEIQNDKEPFLFNKRGAVQVTPGIPVLLCTKLLLCSELPAMINEMNA